MHFDWLFHLLKLGYDPGVRLSIQHPCVALVYVQINTEQMKHGSLESGIGCFDYAAEQIGWENVFSCEIKPFGQQILKHYWPNAKHYTDVFGFNGYEWRGKLDVLTCGFPCQPFSLAGKGKGDKDDRFIWPENMRIIRESQPAYVVAENVLGLLTKHPLVFERVCVNLENEGYEVIPFNIPACATQKDHQRARIFFLAYNQSFRKRRLSIQQRNKGQEGFNADREIENCYTNNNSERLQVGFQSGQRQVGREDETFTRCEPGGRTATGESWIEVATRLCSVDDGNAEGLDTKAISKGSWRKQSIEGYGNAVSWEIAYEIFNTINQFENMAA
jgi:DNA (cytosine-5)-methyltransferase 1